MIKDIVRWLWVWAFRKYPQLFHPKQYNQLLYCYADRYTAWYTARPTTLERMGIEPFTLTLMSTRNNPKVNFKYVTARCRLCEHKKAPGYYVLCDPKARIELEDYLRLGNNIVMQVIMPDACWPADPLVRLNLPGHELLYSVMQDHTV
jgi:hypothetical protein